MAQLNDLIVTGASRLLNGLGILGSTNTDSIFPNVTDTYALGSSNKRWNNLYAKTSNIDTETVGTLTVTNYATIGANQAATGTGTGALRVSGGLSATQNSWFGKSIIMTPSNGVGIKIGAATITSASTTSGEILLQNGHLRFGANNWDYNVWAGLKYDSTNKIIYLGLADGTIFSANSAQSGGTLALPGVRYLSVNGKEAIDAGDAWLRINQNKTFSSGTYFGQSIVRTDNQFQVGDSGNKFYANSSGNGYFSNTLGIAGTNTSYKLYVNGKTKVGDGAAATSTSTGALQVGGGIGVSGNSYFGGTVTATKFIGPLQGNADSSTTLQGWIPSHFYNEYNGTRWYHLEMNNTNTDRTGFYKVADIALPTGYGSYTAAKITGYLYDHNGNWEQVETYIMPFQAIVNITNDVAYLYSNVLANKEHLRIVKTATRTYELQARCNAAHTDFDVYFQIAGAGITPYETLVEGSTTGTVIDITQMQSNGNYAYRSLILANARTFTVGNTSKNFNGSANVSWTLAEIGAVNKAGDTMTGMLTINKTQTAAVFGGSVSNISASAYNPTAGIQICAASGGATNSTAIGFHNPGISSASIGYYNTDANTGQFKFLSDDSNWTVNIGSNVVLHAGNWSSYCAAASHSHSYLPLNGGTMTGSPVITFPASAGSVATSTPTALTYGRLSAYGTLCINANTDNSGTEYVILTAGKGLSSSTTDGLAIGTSTLTWQGSNVLTQANYGSHTHTSVPIAGTNPVPSGSTDTTTTWGEKGNNTTWWYDSSGTLTDKPSDWGFVWNLAMGNDVSQLWFTQSSGKMMRRSGNASGWATSWKQIWCQGDSVTGAVWNDYAECREADIQEAGYVMIEKGDDTLTKSTERMQPFAGVSSDTWGFSQGETEKAKTHIAVAGRVLVYPYRPREEYKSGDCVCAAPGGTVDIMTPNEVALHPDRIVGTVSCVPNYETWGGGELADRDPVQVNGRIWIKVR